MPTMTNPCRSPKHELLALLRDKLAAAQQSLSSMTNGMTNGAAAGPGKKMGGKNGASNGTAAKENGHAAANGHAATNGHAAACANGCVVDKVEVSSIITSHSCSVSICLCNASNLW